MHRFLLQYSTEMNKIHTNTSSPQAYSRMWCTVVDSLHLILIQKKQKGMCI